MAPREFYWVRRQLLSRFMPNGKLDSRQVIRVLAIELIIVALSIGVAFLADHYGHSISNQLSAQQDPRMYKIRVAILLIFFGVGAHFFKRISQWWYGSVEVIFGMASIITISWTLIGNGITLVQWASLIGAAYVVARGLNNMHDARKIRATAAGSR